MSSKSQQSLQDDMHCKPILANECNDTYACAPDMDICHKTKVEACKQRTVNMICVLACKALVELLLHRMLYLPRLPSFLRTTSSVYRIPLPL